MQASYSPKVIPVEIDEDKKKKIVEQLLKEFDEALESRSGLDQKREVWLKQYNSRLVDPTSDEEIQLDIPTTHEFLGQQCARILNPIFSQPSVFMATPRYPSEDKRARALTKALDFVTDKTKLLTVCKQWLSQAQVIAYRMHQMRLAEARTAVNQQRIVGLADILGDLGRSGPRELVRFAFDEIVEGKRLVQKIGALFLGFRLLCDLDCGRSFRFS